MLAPGVVTGEGLAEAFDGAGVLGLLVLEKVAHAATAHDDGLIFSMTTTQELELSIAQDYKYFPLDHLIIGDTILL